MSSRSFARTFLIALALTGCAAAPTPNHGPQPTQTSESTAEVNIPKLTAAPDSEPRKLAGVSTEKMTEPEQKLWWRLVSELYAPCPDQAVSIAACVEKARACSACAPAASFIADHVTAGDSGKAIEVAYAVRFSAPKSIDLRDSPTRGPANAPVTIVEWFDFQCPACRLAQPLIDEAMAKNDGNVRLVHKFYPLKPHRYADGAARGAFAAMQQGKYWDMERTLFANQADLEPASIERYAKDLHLDMARFRADAASDRAAQWIARDRADAEALELDGTPFIWINGRSFNMSHFRIDQDLEPWIRLDAAIAHAAAPSPSIAASAPTSTK